MSCRNCLTFCWGSLVPGNDTVSAYDSVAVFNPLTSCGCLIFAKNSVSNKVLNELNVIIPGND